MSTLAVEAILGYRRYISPRKGFRCAHHAVHGRGSCSDFGLRAFSRLPFWAAVRVMQQRFADCRSAFRSVQACAVTGIATAAAASNDGDESEASKADDPAGRKQQGARDNWSASPDVACMSCNILEIGSCF